MDLEQRLKTPEYQNWVKGTLALIHICDAVREYIRYVFDQFKQNLPDGSHFDGGFNANWMCRRVTLAGQHWTFPSSNKCNHCANLFNEVVRHHLYKDKRMGFENGTTKEVAGSWGIAKIFMPKNCQDVETPEDTDPHALFHMMLNCDLFPLPHKHVEAVIDARNKMMHSRNNTLGEKETKEYIGVMKEFLLEASSQLTSPNCSVKETLNGAHLQIDKLLTSAIHIDILPNTAKEALKYKKEYIIESVSNLANTEVDTKKLKEYLQSLEQLGGEMQFWNRHPWEVGIFDDLKTTREKLNQADREKKTLEENLRKAQAEIQTLRSEITQLELDLSELQEKLNKAETEKEKLEEDLLGAQTELQQLRSEIAQLELGNSELNDKLNEANTEKEKLSENLREASSEISQLNLEVSDLHEKLNEANREKEKLKEDLKETKTKLQTSRSESALLKQKVSELHEMLKEADREKEKLNKDLREAKTELQTSQSEITQHKRELSVIHEKLNFVTLSHVIMSIGWFVLVLQKMDIVH